MGVGLGFYTLAIVFPWVAPSGINLPIFLRSIFSCCHFMLDLCREREAESRFIQVNSWNESMSIGSKKPAFLEYKSHIFPSIIESLTDILLFEQKKANANCRQLQHWARPDQKKFWLPCVLVDSIFCKSKIFLFILAAHRLACLSCLLLSFWR